MLKIFSFYFIELLHERDHVALLSLNQINISDFYLNIKKTKNNNLIHYTPTLGQNGV